MTMVAQRAGADTRTPLDTEKIRQTVQRILNAPRLPDGEELSLLRGTVQGHVQLLAPQVRALAARMPERMRLQAVHVLINTAETLLEGEQITPDGLASHTFDLAIVARSLLSLAERPGPLGDPVHEDEVAAAISRRVCAVCLEEIGGDEPADRVSVVGSAGVIKAYIHAELCVSLRPRLAVVPGPRKASPDGGSDAS